jgi:hypothetical protein
MQALKPLPQDITNQAEITRDLLSNAALRLDDINIEGADLQTTALTTLQFGVFRQTDPATEVQQILKYAIEIDKRLVAWPDFLPRIRRILYLI